jgi:hypothetical protein
MILNFLNKFKTVKTEPNDSICNILISLKSDKQIDLSVFIDEKRIGNTEDTTQQDCAEFLHIINSGKLRNQILSMILDQIDNKNKIAIENIILLLIMLEQKESSDDKKDQSFILPSKVFTRYINGNQ